MKWYRPEGQKNAKKQLEDFIVETDQAIKSGVSMNLTIHSFAITVNEYNIPTDYIQAFFRSMKMDLTKKDIQKRITKITSMVQLK
jgi:phytoene/squalene synthetase